MALAGELVAEMLEGLAGRHRADAKGFVAGYCRVMAGWMEASDFRSGCPIATTLLETAPQSPSITRAGNDALDRRVAIIAGVFASSGQSRSRARRRAQVLIGAVEGALLMARVRQSRRPLLNVATALPWD